ncbi:sensor histidine kinase [Knoellia locipacati]|uniref:Two-component sensor histidine kinase n=1 Tax=Knoellia locipacati TaxID=882824 RepID=A0A512SY23_9MICO|nr:sensor histidine kinase [Knoellia locipacati]GEQ12861.1 two-component sensor histidine kinase [Knoellia locipacati]
MNSAPVPPAELSSDELAQMWRGQAKWWHAGCYALVATAIVVSLIQPAGPHGHPPTVALLLGIAVAYAVLGRRAIQREGTVYAVAYQLCAWACILTVIVIDPEFEAWLLFFCLFPQIWATFEKGPALVGTGLALAALFAATVVPADDPAGAAPGALVSVIISFVLSAALGLFIHRIITEAESRACMIDELRSTRAQLASVERAQGVQDERSRLSREIHDTLAQGFTSVIALSRAATSALDRDDAATARERLAMIERTAVDNLAEARVIVAELTPGHLQSRTLVEALARLTDTVTRETGIRVTSAVEGEPAPLGGNAEVVLLRGVQEALSNVRRHSGATSAAVTLAYEPERVALEVTDDGSGFDPATTPPGFGLDGLRARAAELGGEVSIDRGDPRGTRLVMELPR